MTQTFPRLVMTMSAVLLASLGLPCVFAPDLLMARLAGNSSIAAEVLVQLTGALYVGFAMLNWMSRGSLMGGIYGRPVAVGNVLHFFAGALALLKAAPFIDAPALTWALSLVYTAFAVGFGMVVFRKPPVATRSEP